MSNTSKNLLASIIKKNDSELISAGDIKPIVIELNAFEDSIDPDSNPGTALLDTVTEYTGGSGTTFTTKAIFSSTTQHNGVSTFAEPNIYSSATGIAAVGSTYGTSTTLITKEWTNVTTAGSSGLGVRLPIAVLGKSVTIKNTGANAIKVYAITGSTIDDEASEGFVTIAIEQEVTFKGISATAWESNLENQTAPVGTFTTLNATTGNITTANVTTLAMAGRINGFQGANVTSMASITLGLGNFYLVTGSTQTDGIINAGWQAGSEVTLHFTGAPLVKHNVGGAGAGKIMLAGSADFVTAANSRLKVYFDGTDWWEISRTTA